MAAAGTIALTAGCGEAGKDLKGINIKTELERYTKATLLANDITANSALLCAADIADDGQVTGTCSSTEPDGTEIRTTLNGTIAKDFTSCTATLTVTRGDKTLSEESDLDCSKQFGSID